MKSIKKNQPIKTIHAYVSQVVRPTVAKVKNKSAKPSDDKSTT